MSDLNQWSDYNMNAREKLLMDADSIVNGDRNVQYGDPNQDFRRTATMWGAFLGIELEPWQVAAMMALLKISRIAWSPTKRDSWLDLAGYAACGADCVDAIERDAFNAVALTND